MSESKPQQFVAEMRLSAFLGLLETQVQANYRNGGAKGWLDEMLSDGLTVYDQSGQEAFYEPFVVAHVKTVTKVKEETRLILGEDIFGDKGYERLEQFVVKREDVAAYFDYDHFPWEDESGVSIYLPCNEHKKDAFSNRPVSVKNNFKTAKLREMHSECRLGQFFAAWAVYCESKGECPYEYFRLLMEKGVTVKAGEAGTVAERDWKFDNADVRVGFYDARRAAKISGDDGLQSVDIEILDAPGYSIKWPLSKFILVRANVLDVLKNQRIHDFDWPEYGLPCELTTRNALQAWIEKGLSKHLNHFQIAQLLAADERQQSSTEQCEEAIMQAICDGDLQRFHV